MISNDICVGERHPHAWDPSEGLQGSLEQIKAPILLHSVHPPPHDHPFLLLGEGTGGLNLLLNFQRKREGLTGPQFLEGGRFAGKEG